MSIVSVSDAPYFMMAQRHDPDFAFQYRVPARRWWQFWKPRWRIVDALSRNQILRGHGLPELPPSHAKITII